MDKNGKYISAIINVGTVGYGLGRGAVNSIKNLKSTISSVGNLLSNMKLDFKTPVTYMTAWDNYSTAGWGVEGLHNFNLITDKSYNKLIKIFDPEI